MQACKCRAGEFAKRRRLPRPMWEGVPTVRNLESARSSSGGILVARKQLVTDGATCATCERREVEAFLGPLPKKKPATRPA